MEKYKKKLIAVLLALFMSVFLIGCTNEPIYSNTNSKGTTSEIDYNRAAIAILYAAYPELIAGTGISKTRTSTNTKRDSTTVSQSKSKNQSVVNKSPNGGFESTTNSERVTTTKTRSKSKSVSTGIGVFSGFDF